MRYKELAEAILLSPALQRLHAVFRNDGLPIVPSQAVAQRERVLHAVRRNCGPIDHLRLDPKLLVRAEQGVVHEITVVARDVGGRPDRIENLQIGLCHEAKGLPLVLGVHRRRAQRHSGGRDRAPDDLSATDAVHAQASLIAEVTQPLGDQCRWSIRWHTYLRATRSSRFFKTISRRDTAVWT
jgi:hypothetical protein